MKIVKTFLEDIRLTPASILHPPKLIIPMLMLQKITRIILAVALLTTLSSCGRNDPNETPGFNRNTIRGYMFERAATVDKRPIIIEEISPIQKIVLHGETLSTCAVATRTDGPSGTYLYYFVFAPDHRNYLSGNSNLLQEIDADGYKATLEKISSRKNAASN